MSDSKHYCYILHNSINNKTYNGYTVDLKRRLRQHNSEIKGGAKYTTRACQKDGVKWEYLAVVEAPTDLVDRRKMLSIEWHIKYPSCKRPRESKYNNPHGRLSGLIHALQHEKFIGLDDKLHIKVVASWLGRIQALIGDEKIDTNMARTWNVSELT